MSFDEYLLRDRLINLDFEDDLPLLIGKINLLENFDSIIVKNYTILDLILNIRLYNFKFFIELVKYIWIRLNSTLNSSCTKCYQFITVVKPYLILVLDSEKFEYMLSSIDAKLIMDYSGAHYANINNYLRIGENYEPFENSIIFGTTPTDYKGKEKEIILDETTPTDYKEEARRFDELLTSSTIPKTIDFMVVFRGVYNENLEIFLNNLQIGDIYEQPSFSSTSPQLLTVGAFLGDTCCILKIYLPSGVPCIYIQKYSEFPYEHEILLPTGMGLVLTEKGVTDFFNRDIKIYTFECQYCTPKSRFHNLEIPKNFTHIYEQKYC